MDRHADQALDDFYLDVDTTTDYDLKIKEVRLKYRDLFDKLSDNVIKKNTVRKIVKGVEVERKQKGRQYVRGYTLKSNGKHWYVYVWFEYDASASQSRRKEGHTNYTKMSKEKSLGPVFDEKTYIKLAEHLEEKYGASTEQMDALKEEMEYEVLKLERERRYKFNEIMDKVLYLCEKHNLERPTNHLFDLVKIRNIYKHYLQRAISAMNSFFEDSDIPMNANIEKLEDMYEIQCEMFEKDQQKARG
jgi:hypothetical protein